MWNIKKEASEEVAIPASAKRQAPQMYMNPYELTKQELYRKLKFFSVYITAIVAVPNLLRAFGVLAPLGVVPITRK